MNRVFSETKDDTVALVRRMNQEQAVTFFLPLPPFQTETVQVAYLLSAYLCKNPALSSSTTSYLSFFANSHIEALHGAIKIARHHAVTLQNSSQGAILYFDKSPTLKDLFDPLSVGPEKALIPGVWFVQDAKSAADMLEDAKRSWTALVCGLHDALRDKEIATLASICRAKQTALILDTGRLSPEHFRRCLQHGSWRPDVVVWGEELTANQIPFGAFSTVDHLYTPWNRPHGWYLHSSTYGGNGLALARVRRRILYDYQWFGSDCKALQRVEEIARDGKALEKAFRRFVNSAAADVYSRAGLAVNVVRALGSTVWAGATKESATAYIDCIGGAGCNLRGHNPPDIGSEVLDRHDPRHDYWQDLAKRLCQIYDLAKAFPAVSGASAVEIAFCLALLAGAPRNKVIVLKGNYAGKTLAALNGSAANALREPFRPLSPSFIYVDPFLPEGRSVLQAHLSSGEIALIWFELLQGENLDQVPVEVLALIRAHRSRERFFVGIDEILNGLGRVGGLTSFDKSEITPDIVTVSKGLSDMTFPVAATLASEKVSAMARARNCAIVEQMSLMYGNQLGSHIALHALSSLEARLRDGGAADRLKTRVDSIVARSPFLASTTGKGFHLHLNANPNVYPFCWLSKDECDLLISSRCYHGGQVLLFFGRMLPAINLSDLELEKLIAGLERVFVERKWGLYFAGTLFMLRSLFQRVSCSTPRWLASPLAPSTGV